MTDHQLGELLSAEITKDRVNDSFRRAVSDTQNSLVMSCTPKCLKDRDFRLMARTNPQAAPNTLQLTTAETRCLQECVDGFLFAQQTYYQGALAAVTQHGSN